MAEPEPAYTEEQKQRLASIDLETKELALLKTRLEMSQGVLPDLSTVKDSGLEVEGSVASGTLFADATRKAAERVVSGMNKAGEDQRILVTSDPDLATPTGVAREVAVAFASIEALCAEAESTAADQLGRSTDVKAFAPAGVLAAVNAVSAALPGALSLFVAKRSIKTTAITADDLMAAAEVARAGKRDLGGVWIHDQLRVAENGPLYQRAADLAVTRARIAILKRELEKADPAPPIPVALCTSAITAVDTFQTALRSTPAGDTRTLLSTAAWGQLVIGPPRPWVLFVKSNGGSSTQLTDNRPLLFDDKIFCLVESSITFILIDTDDSGIANSGVASARASLRGDADDELEIRFHDSEGRS